MIWIKLIWWALRHWKTLPSVAMHYVELETYIISTRNITHEALENLEKKKDRSVQEQRDLWRLAGIADSLDHIYFTYIDKP